MLEKLIARLAHVLSHAGLHVFRVVVRPARDARLESIGREVRCERVEPRKLLAAWADPVMELTEQHVRSAFERGDICIGACVDARLIGYQWIAFGPTPHVEGLWIQVRIGPGDCYFYKLFVHPEFRGLRIADALSAGADKAVIDMVRDRVFGFIEVHNLPSWKAIKRRGGRTVGYVGYLRCPGMRIPFRTAGAARYGAGFFVPRIAETGRAPRPS